MTKPRQPKWIQTQYDIIEQQNKYQKHKLSKREFMKEFANGKRDRIPEGSGASDGDILDGEVPEQTQETEGRTS